MFNDKPCDTCHHFDPILKGGQKGLKETDWGWCAKKSVYPAKEGPGQVFPAGVQRVSDPASPAEPFIVRRGEVKGNCTAFSARKSLHTKQDLLKKLQEQNGGRIIG
jgi:hypothetical protein